MLSCLVPPRFGQDDQIMPSQTAFSLQFPSLASSLHHTDKQHFDNSTNYHHNHHPQNSTPSPPISTTSPISGGTLTPSDLTTNHHHLQQHLGNGHHHHHHYSLQQQQHHQDQQQRQHQHAMAMAIANMTGAKSPTNLNGYDEGGRSTSSPGSSTTLGDLCSSLNGAGGPLGVSGPGGPNSCAQCAAAFPSRDMLEKHEMMHSPNTTVSCKVCNKKFANVYRLQRHMISHDESALLRKFKCTECDKAFKFKHHLKEHIRIHSGEKPFVCDNCGKRFSHSGSFSSHMTSKKCISLGLKLNNNRSILKSLEKSSANGALGLTSPNSKRPSLPPNPMSYFSPSLPNVGLNSNSAATGTNAFYPTLPKYGNYDAAAVNAALLATLQNPFYGMGLDPRIHPYSIHRILELTAAVGNRLHDPEDMIEEVTVTEDAVDDQKLVMDIEDQEEKEEDNNTEKAERNSSPPITENLDRQSSEKELKNSMNQSVENLKKEPDTELKPLQLKRENTEQEENYDRQNMTTPLVNPESPEIKVEETAEEILECGRCSKRFNHQTELVQHEKVLCSMQDHEELVRRLEPKKQEQHHPSEPELVNTSFVASGSEEDVEDRESKTGSEGERKVRVRTAITEEQQTILKEHYAINSRPSRDEFRMIALRLALDPRVVQVWFQNNRSRERKLNSFKTFASSNIIHSDSPSFSPSSAPTLANINTPPTSSDDQPLDLSVKKENIAVPSNSPRYGLVPLPTESLGSEAINLSRKPSRSPASFTSPRYYNASTPNQRPLDMPSFIRQTPSPSEATPPRHPPHPPPHPNSYVQMLVGSRGLVRPDYIRQMPPEYARNQLLSLKLGSAIGERGTSLSPGSEKRSWRDDESRISHDDEFSFHASKRLRLDTSGNSDADCPFVCDQCDKAFSKQSSLARHKYEHSGQRPYKCEECPKAFKHKHHLTEHKRLHSGEKPFQCTKCLKRFSHSGSYSQHMNHRYSYCKPYRE